MHDTIQHKYQQNIAKGFVKIILNGLRCISQLAQEHACSIPLFGASM